MLLPGLRLLGFVKGACAAQHALSRVVASTSSGGKPDVARFSGRPNMQFESAAQSEWVRKPAAGHAKEWIRCFHLSDPPLKPLGFGGKI